MQTLVDDMASALRQAHFSLSNLGKTFRLGRKTTKSHGGQSRAKGNTPALGRPLSIPCQCVSYGMTIRASHAFSGSAMTRGAACQA